MLKECHSLKFVRIVQVILTKEVLLQVHWKWVNATPSTRLALLRSAKEASCGAEHQLTYLCFTAVLVASHQQEDVAWQDTDCNTGPPSYHSQKAEKMETRVSQPRGRSSWAYSSLNTFIQVKQSQTIKNEFKVEFQVKEKQNYNQKWARQYSPRLVGDGGIPLLLLIYTLL